MAIIVCGSSGDSASKKRLLESFDLASKHGATAPGYEVPANADSCSEVIRPKYRSRCPIMSFDNLKLGQVRAKQRCETLKDSRLCEWVTIEIVEAMNMNVNIIK